MKRPQILQYPLEKLNLTWVKEVIHTWIPKPKQSTENTHVKYYH